jgi:NAD(P)-dependent dehydrogenase (short-subunit alcohol dehydrogenase family)
VEEINGNESKAEYYPLDVTNEARVKEVVDAVYEKYGKIDIPVNNAGIASPNKPMHEHTKEEWNCVFEVNVTGAILCTKFTLPT